VPTVPNGTTVVDTTIPATVKVFTEPCQQDEKACMNRQCIRDVLFCDNRSDCVDGSDEFNCEAENDPPSTQSFLPSQDDLTPDGQSVTDLVDSNNAIGPKEKQAAASAGDSVIIVFAVLLVIIVLAGFGYMGYRHVQASRGASGSSTISLNSVYSGASVLAPSGTSVLAPSASTNL
jgi:hypothetical protein